MNHLMFLIWFIAFQMGILSLFISYTKKDKIPFISFHYVMSILVVVGALYRLITIYLLANLGFEGVPWYVVIFRLFSDSAILYFLPVTLHALLMIEAGKLKKIVFIILAAAYFPFPLLNILTGFRFAFVHKAFYVVLAIYCLIFILTGYKKLNNGKIRRIVKVIAYTGLSVFIFLIAVHIMFNRKINNIHSFTYLVFILYWLFITIYYVKNYCVEPDEIKNFAEKNSLTQREEEIMQFLVLGKTNNDIADRLSISANTVRTHIQNISEKLNVKSKLEIMSLFYAQREN